MSRAFSRFGPKFLTFWFLVLALIFATSPAFAQNIVSGEVAGVVTDATGAVVPNATVTLTSTEMGVKQDGTTSDGGSYRFPLLRPGVYGLSVSKPGFATTNQSVTVAVGQVVNVPVQLRVGVSSETVEVTFQLPVLETENANLATTYDPGQIENMPNPGGDLTNYALSSPGVALSTGAGYGNFTAFGMPGTSNLYTINGNDMNDPFNNLNNSGSSNNMLGTNEIQEVALVHNGYTGQYGRAASETMTFTTKSGTNSFHGNAKWDWNGRYLNANDWFNKNSGTPRPFANSNQWGGSFGGPIKKDKLFFFYDNEGLRYVLPGGGTPVYIPTPTFASAVEANISANQPAESSFYKTVFQLYSQAPGANRATPAPGDGGCGDIVKGPLGGVINGTTFGPGAQACTETFRSTVNNLNKERLQAIRVDLEASATDRMNWRYFQDRGTQPTFTDPINPAFNSLSVQPQDVGNFNETHIFSSSVVNQFIASGSYYGAIFGPADLAATTAVFPTTIGGNQGSGNNCTAFDGNLSCLGGEVYRYPQGRNVTWYQVVDDLSWTRGNHGLKFGANLRRVDFSDFRPARGHTGVINLNSMTDFANGVLSSTGGSTMVQVFSNATHYPIAMYSLGMYAQDEWRATSKLRVTFSLRADRNSNETCRKNCFSRLAGNFFGLSTNPNTPLNQLITAGQGPLFPSVEKVALQPRLGFAYQARQSTVVRAGVGLFSDLYPAQLADNILRNAPLVSNFTIQPTTNNPAPIPLAPGVPNGAFGQAAASNAAFASDFANGGSLNSITAAVPTFATPTMYSVVQNFKNPKYLEWNIEVQQAIGTKTSVNLGYVGNHGYDLIVLNNGVNAFATTGFEDLRTTAPNPNFKRVQELTNGGTSNYGGLLVGVSRTFTKGFQGALNYTWSHALDSLSNGGIDQYSFNTTGDSLPYQIDPFNLRKHNYGNADYDFTHVLTFNYVWELPFKSSNGLLDRALGGWTISQVLYKRSGEPYSVVNSTIPTSVMSNNTANFVLADFVGGSIPGCTVNFTQGTTPFQCLNPSQFTTSQTNFGNIGRNRFRGPGFFNTDLTIKKNFRITESGLMFTIGANAYNILNHPHFANPDDSITSGTFGQVQSTVVPASSPYGNFQGSSVSGRVLQLEMEVKF
jgi:hypothetical protein